MLFMIVWHKILKLVITSYKIANGILFIKDLVKNEWNLLLRTKYKWWLIFTSYNYFSETCDM